MWGREKMRKELTFEMAKAVSGRGTIPAEPVKFGTLKMLFSGISAGHIALANSKPGHCSLLPAP